jgi:hypothetical protein
MGDVDQPMDVHVTPASNWHYLIVFLNLMILLSVHEAIKLRWVAAQVVGIVMVEEKREGAVEEEERRNVQDGDVLKNRVTLITVENAIPID